MVMIYRTMLHLRSRTAYLEKPSWGSDLRTANMRVQLHIVVILNHQNIYQVLITKTKTTREKKTTTTQ